MAMPMVPFTQEGPQPSENSPALVGSIDFFNWIRDVRDHTLHPHVQQPENQSPGLSMEEAIRIALSTNDARELTERLGGTIGKMRWSDRLDSPVTSEEEYGWPAETNAPMTRDADREYFERERREWPVRWPATHDRCQIEELPRHIPVHVEFVDDEDTAEEVESNAYLGVDEGDMWISLEMFPEAADPHYRDPTLPYAAYRRVTEFSVDTVRRRHRATAVYVMPENMPTTSAPRAPGVWFSLLDERFLWLGYRQPIVYNDPVCGWSSNPATNDELDMVMVLTQYRGLEDPNPEP
ncbi:hypothetical protein TWF696_006456 [Orbilia brochopaga]|uniref:Uncharacterized protein n=1 Tax=Orbilia brochopaga TaxID=3140254 RepID=A0AAV9UWE5_9PEZI